MDGGVGGLVGGGRITLGIMQTQPSLAGVGAGAELGNTQVSVTQFSWIWSFYQWDEI